MPGRSRWRSHPRGLFPAEGSAGHRNCIRHLAHGELDVDLGLRIDVDHDVVDRSFAEPLGFRCYLIGVCDQVLDEVSPSGFTLDADRLPLQTSVTVIAALGTTAPVLSVIVPKIDP